MGINIMETQTSNTNKPHLSFEEACDYLSLSESYLYKLTHKKLIPHYKMPTGKKLVFRKDELDKWLTSVPVSTIEEIDQQAYDYLNLGRRERRAR
jgi:excisionase family DNA binding protein